MAGKRERILSRWGFVMADGSGPVLAGEEGLGMHRTSTPLVSFDADAMTGVTSSGRPYRLAGAPEPGYALSVFHSLWVADGVDVRIVGLEEALVLIEGNEPFAFPPEEQARLDGLKLRHLAQSVASQMRIQDLSVGEAAAIASLPADRLRALLEHDMSGITPDEADRALSALVARLWGYRTGIGSIFRDLGLPNADVLLAKSELALGIRDLISEKGLSVEDAAVIAGMEPAVLLGALERPHRSGLSIERFDKIYEALIEVPGRKL